MAPFPSIPGLRLERVLGVGRSGTVYAARQEDGLELEVAVKVVHPHLVYSEFDARFEVEKAALAGLHHPGIARVLESGTSDEGLPYLVLERIDGLPIDEHCDRHALTIESRLELFEQAAAAVEAAHRQGVLHRDLKPANILVAVADDVPVVKIIDFGLAKLLDPSPEHALESMNGSQLGTPLYMAPEQFGFAGPVDTRADVYALGAVLYELLCGHRVVDLERLEGLDPFQQREALKHAPHVKPSERVRAASDPEAVAKARGTSAPALTRRLRGELDAMCLHALARDRDERYPSARALAEDVRRHLRRQPLQMTPPGLGYVLRKAASRHRALTATVAVALLAIVGLGVGLVMTTREARQQTRDARALSDFLLGHFSGQSTALRDVALPRAEVDRAYEELLRQDVAIDPSATAEAFERLSLAYRDLDDLDQADLVLTEAIARLLRPAVAESVLALEVTLERVELGLRSGMLARADSLVRHVLGRADGSTALRVQALDKLGRVAAARGRMGEAIESFRAALNEGRFEGPRWSEEARLRSDLGFALNRVRRSDEAVVELRRALDLLDGHGGGRPRERARVLHNLGVGLCGRREFAAAVPVLEEAVRLQRPLVEARETLGMTLNDLANAVWETGDESRAFVLYLEALQAKVEVFGEGSATTATTLSSLGDIHASQGRHAEAVACYRDAVAALTRPDATEHPYLGPIHFALGSSLEALDLLDEALASYEVAARVDAKHLGEDHAAVADDRAAADRVRAALASSP